ncbi:MAG: aldo/keto reductase [Anaerolineaceae bacterium]|nr:aldo/keto reductase [Anaerolineaceae bacterium]
MNYRKFGKLDWQVSALGFGAMRLPLVEGTEDIDEELAQKMVRTAIDGGVNYVDTAYGYHRSKSEEFVGRALKDGYREKVHLATKMPSWLVKTHDDLDRLLEEQLTRLDDDHIDFYLLHALNAKYWKNYKALNVFEWAEKKISEGVISHLGFSFHDDYPVFHEIINGYDNWTFCQVQHNYMDIDHQQGQKGVNEAAERGLAVVVMEPIRGGSLAKEPSPGPVSEAMKRSSRAWKPAEWALQWVWDQPQVSVVLSGMSTMQQVEENLVSASRSGAGMLSSDDLAVIEDVRKAYYSLTPIPCTKCEYCLPCPSDVAIPSIFALYNEAAMYGSAGGQRWQYANNIKPENRADNCIECGTCENVCPQKIEIIDWLKKADAFLLAKD